MSTLKQRIGKVIGIKTLEIRKYKDPHDPGSVLVAGGETYLVLSQFRRGFFTIYTVVRFRPTGISLIDNVRKAVIRALYAIGLRKTT